MQGIPLFAEAQEAWPKAGDAVMAPSEQLNVPPDGNCLFSAVLCARHVERLRDLPRDDFGFVLDPRAERWVEPRCGRGACTRNRNGGRSQPARCGGVSDGRRASRRRGASLRGRMAGARSVDFDELHGGGIRVWGRGHRSSCTSNAANGTRRPYCAALPVAE